MRWFGKGGDPAVEEAPKTREVEQPAEDRLKESAQVLVDALVEFELAAREAYEPRRGADLIAAERKVAAAWKVIKESGVEHALLRGLWEEVRHWHAWIVRSDFMEEVNFEAANVEASQEKDPRGKGKRYEVSFDFKGRRYTIRLHDKGVSYLPDDSERWGEVEFFENGERVLQLGVKEELSGKWHAISVGAFKSAGGDWMRALLEIDVQIERSHNDLLASYRNRDTLDAAKNIEL